MMGMTAEQYWDGESWLVKGYRKAWQIRKEQEYREMDEAAWNQGQYIRLALQSVYLMVNGFVPKGSQAEKYPEKPFSVRAEEEKREKAKLEREENRRKAEEQKAVNSMALFQAMADAFNRGFKKRQEEQAKGIRTS